MAERNAHRPTRISFSRAELVDLVNALEAVIEEFKYDGGLVLAEREMQLYERLLLLLRKHDRVPTRTR